jgi:5-methylcytosine-specific restriction endonuclease McrA
LTGRTIDLLKPKTYQCDHILPVSKGGKSSLENMGLACKEANQAKSDMIMDDFLKLCKEVLEHNGYTVSR